MKGQCWTRENLVVTRFNNGANIPYIAGNTTWTSTTNPARVYYDLDSDNAEPYGFLYNWYAASDNRNLCPTDWHVPSDDDWKALEQLLGMSSSDLDRFAADRGEDQNIGGWMKETGTSNWSSPNTGATSGVGFDTVPGGKRDHNTGEFEQKGIVGYYWSSSMYQYRANQFNAQNVVRFNGNVRIGKSIRCVMNQ